MPNSGHHASIQRQMIENFYRDKYDRAYSRSFVQQTYGDTDSIDDSWPKYIHPRETNQRDISSKIHYQNEQSDHQSELLSRPNYLKFNVCGLTGSRSRRSKPVPALANRSIRPMNNGVIDIDERIRALTAPYVNENTIRDKLTSQLYLPQHENKRCRLDIQEDSIYERERLSQSERHSRIPLPKYQDHRFRRNDRHSQIRYDNGSRSHGIFSSEFGSQTVRITDRGRLQRDTMGQATGSFMGYRKHLEPKYETMRMPIHSNSNLNRPPTIMPLRKMFSPPVAPRNIQFSRGAAYPMIRQAMIKISDGTTHRVRHSLRIRYTFKSQTHIIQTLDVPSIAVPLRLGGNFWKAFKIKPVNCDCVDATVPSNSRLIVTKSKSKSILTHIRIRRIRALEIYSRFPI